MSKLTFFTKSPKIPRISTSISARSICRSLKKMPGLRGFSFGPARALDGGEGAFFWMFIGTFDSLKAINDALASPEGQKVVADIPNYYHETPTILHLDSTDG